MNSSRVFSQTFNKVYNVDEAEFIGSGSYAEVFKIFEAKINKFLAIRKVTKTQQVMPDIEKQISITQLLKTVKSEQILEIFDIIQKEDCIWYVTEYCEGGSLWETLANSPELKFSETDSLKVALEIAKGVQQLHSKRITHGDLKPENILFSEIFKPGKEPKLKIADFGLSTCNIIMETVAGTKQYLAPEQAKFNTYTNAVDIWSLGIMLDEMLHGTLFYTGETNKQVFDKILKVQYEVRDTALSEKVKELLLKVLKKKAYERPIVASIIKGIEEILSTDPQEEKPKIVNKVFQRRKMTEVETKKQVQIGKSPFGLKRNQKSRERPRSRHETPKGKKQQVISSISIGDLETQIAQQRCLFQKFKLRKERILFNPAITLKEVPLQNPLKSQLQNALPCFGYLNTFVANDPVYSRQIGQTATNIQEQLKTMRKSSEEVRSNLKQKVLCFLDEYIDQQFQGITF